MDRRNFLTKGTASVALGLASRSAKPAGHSQGLDWDATGAAIAETSEWQPGDPIGYVNPEIPQFEVPPYTGERYEAPVPDTLDIAERARLAINGLTEVTDPLADYETYSFITPLTNPPSMRKNCWYGPWDEDYMGALTRCRLVSGSEQNMKVERRWMEVLLKLQAPDGLLYVPVSGRPWAFEDWQIRDVAKPRDQILQAYTCGSMLRTMSVYAPRDPDGPWRKAMRRLIDGLISVATVDGDYAYFYPSCFITTKERPAHPPMPTRPIEVEASNMLLGMVDSYRVLGYEAGLNLAKKQINYLRKNFYGPDGSFFSMPGLALEAHTGAHLRGLLAMQECAEATGDKQLMEFVVRAFERAIFCGANVEPGVSDYDLVKTPGAALVGFVPEWTSSPALQTSETDQVVDMIGLALRLSAAGVGDYWDDADRWIRNQFAENQLVETDWIYEVSKSGPPAEKTSNVTTDRVPERAKGGFAGCPSANDWCGRVPSRWTGIGLCCTAYGSNGLFWIWEHILRYEEGHLKVNLLLNRASPWADVDSHIPYQGRVDVKIKKAVELSVRIPEWVSPDQARCQINRQETRVSWEGRYAKIGRVIPGDVVTMDFPIFERTNKVWIEKRLHTLVRKGNEVVSIDPPGVRCPLYQRQHYRPNETRMRKVSRFVSNETNG
jgi:hypothetical protein